MRFRKRYLVLIVFAILPLIKFVHLGDYCFGIADLLIIGGLSILFFIAFLVTLFYNLYKISLKRELFNFSPLIIATLLALVIYLGYKYHDKNMFKEQQATYLEESIVKKPTQITLFKDQTFEVKTFFKEYYCAKNGSYQIKKDSLFLYQNDSADVVLDRIYFIDTKSKKLIPNSLHFKSLQKIK